MNPIVYSVEGMDSVTVHANLRYADASDALRVLDLFLPAAAQGGTPVPVVCLLHGGVPEGAPMKDHPIFQSWGRLLAASGLAAVALTHRLGFPRANLAAAIADVEAALSYVRDPGRDWPIDRERVALQAFSAGGPLLGIGVDGAHGYVKCLSAFYAFMDIRHSPLHAEEGTAEFLARYSPTAIYETDAVPLPIFVARAGRDRPELNASIDVFATTALARNAPLTLLNHPHGEHGFDMLNDDARTKEIIAADVAFLRAGLAA